MPNYWPIGGGVADVTATAPIHSTGGDTPDISITNFAGSAPGAVPTATPGDASKFLKGSGAWDTPAGTGVSAVTGAAPITSTGGATPQIGIVPFTGPVGIVDGTPGAVPAPLAGEDGLFLRGDGGWHQPVLPYVSNVFGTLPITSSGGPTPTIDINNFGGANGVSAGSKGAVPIPNAADNVKFLKGNGTWDTPAGTGITAVTASAPATSSGGATPNIAVPNMVGDSGAGGTNGLVPSPAVGDATKYLSGAGTWVAQPYDLVFSFIGNPSAGATVYIYTAVRAVSLPANFSGSRGSVGTNPTGTATFTVLVNGVSIGTVAISAAGAFTFATVGGTAKSLAIGDKLTITGPNPQDATLANPSFTLAGTR